jgi:hypothetical protein
LSESWLPKHAHHGADVGWDDGLLSHAVTTAIRVLALLSLIATACKRDEAAPPARAPAAVNIDDPAACKACHPAIVDEWQESMHARAHHSLDPIYAGVRALRVAKEGPGITTACAGCHTPGFEGDPEAAGARVGVGCATCHNRRVGAAPGQLLGPNDVAAGATHAHGTGPGQVALSDGTSMCMTCHASLQTPSGLSMCATGAEHAASTGDAKQPCASCHMPRSAGPATVGSPRADHATHAFLGPHRLWYQDDDTFMKTSVRVEATLTGRVLSVSVANTTGHAFPTGFPGRLAVISCTGRDATGAAVWQCEPRKLGKVYVDADGKPTLAPFAIKLALDTRIPAGKAEIFEVETPPEVSDVEVSVSLRLVPESLATRLGLAAAPERSARTIARVTSR